MEVVAVVQARMGSSRLPGKVLKEILGKPMLWHLINRLKAAELVDEIVIATSSNQSNKPIIKFAQENGINYYAGSEDDLLDRIYRATREFNPDAIVRVTGDCPLIDPVIVDKVIRYYLNNKDGKHRFDLVCNYMPRTYPRGLDTEVVSFEVWERAWRELSDVWRERVPPYFFEHPEKYRLGNVAHDRDLSYMRWTVDYQDDLDFVTEIYKRLYQEDKIFLMEDILNLLKKNPELMEINKGHLS